jgi:hypothetical protein
VRRFSLTFQFTVQLFLPLPALRLPGLIRLKQAWRLALLSFVSVLCWHAQFTQLRHCVVVFHFFSVPCTLDTFHLSFFFKFQFRPGNNNNNSNARIIFEIAWQRTMV